MDLTAQYIAVWKKINWRKRQSVQVESIHLTEPIHQTISADMEKKIDAQVPKKRVKKEEWAAIVNRAAYSIVVRKLDDGYSLLAGHVGYEILRRMHAKMAKVFVTEEDGRDVWIEEMKKTITLTPIVDLEELKPEEQQAPELEVKASLDYLVHNKDFKDPILINVEPSGSISVKRGAAEILAAKMLGLTRVKTTLI